MQDKCNGHTRSGKPCDNPPIKGGTVCRMHGGSAPQVREAANKKVIKAHALEVAQRMCDRDGVDIDPIDHLLDSLHLASQLVRVYGSMVGELDDVSEEMPIEHRGIVTHDYLLTADKKETVTLHPYVQAYHEALDRRAKIAKLCIDAGIAEMQLEILNKHVDQAQEALEATLNSLDLDRAQREAAKVQYANHLRAYQAA